MRSEWEMSRWLRQRPFLVDGGLALIFLVVSVPALWVDTDYLTIEAREPDALGVALTVMSCLPVAWRRQAPVAAFAASGVPSVVLAAMGYVQGMTGVIVLVLLYSVATYRGRGASLWCLAASLVAAAIVVSVHRIPSSPFDYVANFGLFAAAWAFGRSLRVRRAYVSELEGRARQLEATRQADSRAVVAEERGRIARELHDVVAHHVSVMTVQAAAAQRTMARDADQARDAMAAVEQTGRAALVEMRRIVGVLRSDDEAADARMPQPGLADLVSLVEQVRETGLDVRLDVVGDPTALDTGVDLALFRVVQEALTNTIKHAGPSRALVTLTFDRGTVEVRVSDDGRGAAAALDRHTDRAGHGLLGMRERVGIYGGHLDAGPRPGGGFEVRARFPVEQASA